MSMSGAPGGSGGQLYPGMAGAPPPPVPAGSAYPGPPNLSNASTVPTSRIELIVSAKNLLDRDTFSKSDPVCVLYSKDVRTNQYMEVGRTEQVKNNLSPSWNTKFTLDYRFEERQVFKFAIYDWDGKSYGLEAHDFLGSMECSLGEIVAASNKKIRKKAGPSAWIYWKRIVHCGVRRRAWNKQRGVVLKNERAELGQKGYVRKERSLHRNFKEDG